MSELLQMKSSIDPKSCIYLHQWDFLFEKGLVTEAFPKLNCKIFHMTVRGFFSWVPLTKSIRKEIIQAVGTTVSQKNYWEP